MSYNLTEQQKDILDIDLKDKDRNIVLIPALAGSGKTTTLLEKVKKHPDLNFCYLSFNRAIKEEIEKVVKKDNLDNLSPMTMHGLSYKNVLPKFGYPPINNLSVDNIQRMFPNEYNLKVWMIYKTILLFNKYCNQVLSFKEYKEEVYKMSEKELSYLGFTKNNLGLFSQCFDYVERLYNNFVSKKSGFITHNFYLKYFIDNLDSFNFKEYDVFLFDEAQDLNEPMAVFVREIIKKNIPLILVGDTNQTIYGFIKSIDVISQIDEALPDRVIKKQLTKSFRFPNNSVIENNCNLILNLRDEEIEGVANYDNLEEITTEGYLSRINKTIFEKCLELIEEEKTFDLMGGIESFDLNTINDIYSLMVFNKSVIKNKYIKSFDTIEDLIATVNENSDIELGSNITIASICKKNSKTPEEMFRLIRNNIDIKSNIKVGTIHKTKGLGFDYVEIMSHSGDKYLGMSDEQKIKKSVEDETYTVLTLKDKTNTYEEFNILYVGMSRAKKKLTINDTSYYNTIQLLKNINSGTIEIIEIDNSIIRGKQEKYIKLDDDNLIHQKDFDIYLNKIKGRKRK